MGLFKAREPSPDDLFIENSVMGQHHHTSLTGFDGGIYWWVHRRRLECIALHYREWELAGTGWTGSTADVTMRTWWENGNSALPFRFCLMKKCWCCWSFEQNDTSECDRCSFQELGGIISWHSSDKGKQQKHLRPWQNKKPHRKSHIPHQCIEAGPGRAKRVHSQIKVNIRIQKKSWIPITPQIIHPAPS